MLLKIRKHRRACRVFSEGSNDSEQPKARILVDDSIQVNFSFNYKSERVPERPPVREGESEKKSPVAKNGSKPDSETPEDKAQKDSGSSGNLDKKEATNDKIQHSNNSILKTADSKSLDPIEETDSKESTDKSGEGTQKTSSNHKESKPAGDSSPKEPENQDSQKAGPSQKTTPKRENQLPGTPKPIVQKTKNNPFLMSLKSNTQTKSDLFSNLAKPGAPVGGLAPSIQSSQDKSKSPSIKFNTKNLFQSTTSSAISPMFGSNRTGSTQDKPNSFLTSNQNKIAHEPFQGFDRNNKSRFLSGSSGRQDGFLRPNHGLSSSGGAPKFTSLMSLANNFQNKKDSLFFETKSNESDLSGQGPGSRPLWMSRGRGENPALSSSVLSGENPDVSFTKKPGTRQNPFIHTQTNPKNSFLPSNRVGQNFLSPNNDYSSRSLPIRDEQGARSMESNLANRQRPDFLLNSENKSSRFDSHNRRPEFDEFSPIVKLSASGSSRLVTSRFEVREYQH